MVYIKTMPSLMSRKKYEQPFCFVFVFYLENHSMSKQKKGAYPIIRTNIKLSIPNIIMTPSLDEVQQTLNKAVDSIVKVMKGVRHWSKERISKVGVFNSLT